MSLKKLTETFPQAVEVCVIENTVAFAPKYRRKVFYGTKRLEIGQILRQVCNWYGVKLLAGQLTLDDSNPFNG